MRARLLVLAAAALFSTGGAAVKGTQLNAWQVAGGRSLIAAMVIFALLPEARRSWRWRHAPVAATYGATLIMFVAATKLTTSANAIFLQSAAPLFVLLLSPLILKERIRRTDLLVMAAIGAGMGLFFVSPEHARSTAPDPARGNILAAFSAVTWALTVVGLRWIGRDGLAHAGLAPVTLGNRLVSAAALPFAFPVSQVHWPDIGVLLWLGVFQVALAYVCLTRGLRDVPAIEATTLMMLEPALNPLWAWLIHGERPASYSLAGGGIIFIAILGQAWYQKDLAEDLPPLGRL